ncbi:MAG: ATP-binding protein [Maricaulaceae bacterium]
MVGFAIAGTWTFLHPIVAEAVRTDALRREAEITEATPTPAARLLFGFRTTPYGPQDTEAYRRPDGADAHVFGWLSHSSRSLLYLYGASGAGKSSLMAAGVLPKLRKDDWLTITARVDEDPEAGLRQALREAKDVFDTPPPDDTSLADLIDRAAEHARAKGRTTLLVLDQFEEFLILHDEAERGGLAALLQDLHDSPRRGFKLLCVFRTDYRALLYKGGLPPAQDGETSVELAPFNRRAAQAFLSQGLPDYTAAGFDKLFAGLDKIEDARGLYRPITLNMAGLALSRAVEGSAADPGKLIDQYLRDSIAEGPAQDLAPAVLNALITDAGTKAPQTVEALTAATGMKAWHVKATLSHLDTRGLVRPQTPDKERWEIAHDFLAR